MRRVTCNCTKGCKNGHCPCVNEGKKCVQSCGCTRCQNSRTSSSSSSSNRSNRISCQNCQAGCLDGRCPCVREGKKCRSSCGCIDCENLVSSSKSISYFQPSYTSPAPTYYSNPAPTSYPQNPHCPNIINSSHVCSGYCWQIYLKPEQAQPYHSLPAQQYSQSPINSLTSQLNVMTFNSTTTSIPSPNIGQTINPSELTLISKLGEGTFGEVWKGVWRCAINVAIKKMKGATQSVIGEAKKEAQFLLNNRFSNIVLFYGLCEDSTNGLLLVTELMEGGDLHSLLHEDKVKLTPSQMKHIALDIASGLCFLHSQSPIIVHRDLKSMNILLDRTKSNAKIGDFGLAKTKNTLSMLSKVTGTYNWMAPEVMQDTPYNEKADVYSFGMVLYEMATNQIPFHHCNQMQLLHKILKKERPALDQVPMAIRILITKCWDEDPNKRPAMKEVRCMIEQFNI